ncbi:MAG TPA: hypothetical protein VG013_22810 [Gemmataceae bacterium]|nr:hypothetical protein [Gemmataceae bacterium]
MVPRTILRQLSRLRWRERGLRLAWGATRWLAVAVALLAAACLADWLIDRREDTPWALRLGMLVAQAVLWVVLAAVLVARPLLRHMSDSRLALWVEDRAPRLGHRLISAVQLNRPNAQTAGMSPALIAAVTREAEQQAAAMRFARMADHRRLKWSALLAAPFALAVAAVFVLWPATIMALLARQFLADRDIPRSVRLESASRELVWPSGEEVVLRFRATGDAITGGMRGDVRIDPDGEPSAHYPLVLESMRKPGEAVFVARVPPSAVDFAYHAWLEDGRTHRPSLVHFEPQPAVIEQKAWLQLPEYVGLRPGGQPYEQEQPRGDIIGLPHCKARVAVRTQKPVVRATLELIGQSRRRLNLHIGEDGQTADGTFDLRSEERAYRVLVEDRYGFKNADPARRSIRIVTAEPPLVTLLPERFPSADDEGPAEDSEVDGVPVPLGGSIRVAYSCTALYGLGRARLRYRVNEGDWTPLPLTEMQGSAQTGAFDPRRGAFEHSGWRDQVEFHAAPSPDPATFWGRTEGGGRFDFQTRRISDLKVGDRVEFYVEAFDRDPDPEALPGRSESRVKTVVTGPELETWVRQTLQEESRIRRLEARQHGIFGRAGSGDEDDTAAADTTSADAPEDEPAAPVVLSTFVRNWQLLGPFANTDDRGHEQAYPPESDRTDLGKQYDGLAGKIRWRLHESDRDKIDLEQFFAHSEAGVAYAVCWVHSPVQKRALLATGSDDGIKAWVNRNLATDKHVHREAVAGDDKQQVQLASGWNELLVKVDNTFGTWAFYLELRDPNTGKPLQGIQFRTTPPPGVPTRLAGSPRPGPVAPKFVRNWMLIGMFPNPNDQGFATAYPPEREPVILSKQYDGLNGKVRWKLHHSGTDKIDFAKFFNFNGAAVAYAVCWVYSAQPRQAVLAVGSDDGIKTWVNRQLVIAKHVKRPALPAQDMARVGLKTGWNEVLVKVDNEAVLWEFYLELSDPNTGLPLNGITFRTTPPGAVAKKFVRNWQLLGPFPNPDNRGHNAPYPPEKEKLDFGKEYDGIRGKMRWTLHHSSADYINLSQLYAHRAPGVAYAVCWVRSDRQKPVLLSIGSNDGIKIWVNRKVAFSHQIGRAAKPGQDKARTDLAAGWNELLVKVDNIANDWGFYLELLDPGTGKPLKGIAFRTTPPDDGKKK